MQKHLCFDCLILLFICLLSLFSDSFSPNVSVSLHFHTSFLRRAFILSCQALGASVTQLDVNKDVHIYQDTAMNISFFSWTDFVPKNSFCETNEGF